MCQDWTKLEGPGTWVINAKFGAPVPTMGQIAMGILTYELARACNGQDCNLPPSTRQVVRQGVTMSTIDAKDLLDNNLTGLWLPDKFIMSINPNSLQDRARAYSVDAIYDRLQG